MIVDRIESIQPHLSLQWRRTQIRDSIDWKVLSFVCHFFGIFHSMIALIQWKNKKIAEQVTFPNYHRSNAYYGKC